MCKALVCGLVLIVVGTILVIATAVLSFGMIPGIIENAIIETVVLKNDTEQMERFEDVPVTINFTVRLFSINNPEEFVNGAVPVVSEAGPYIYGLSQRREITHFEEDKLKYRIHYDYQFNAEASYPRTEDDIVTMINIPYFSVLGVAEEIASNLMGAVNLGLQGIFGDNNKPIANFRVGDLLFKGIPICANPTIVSGVVCNIIRGIANDVQNMNVQNDGTILFSLLGYKNSTPSLEFEVYRGKEDINDVGRIITFDELPHFSYWTDYDENEVSTCNTIKGTDSNIYSPFVSRDEPLYAVNPDICRTVRLDYRYDSEYEGITGLRFETGEDLHANYEGCYCLNVTRGINRDDGCLFNGAVELYTCTGAHLVLTYPHLMYTNENYTNNIIGLIPDPNRHIIFIEIEPNTGITLRGAKRAQFNLFTRSIRGIPDTQNVRTTLMPLFWVEETMNLPDEFVNMLTDTLLFALDLVGILVPVIVSVSCVILLAGIVVIIVTRFRKKSNTETAKPNK